MITTERPFYGSSQILSVDELEEGLTLERIYPGPIGLPQLSTFTILAIGQWYNIAKHTTEDDPGSIITQSVSSSPLRLGNLSLRDAGVLPRVNSIGEEHWSLAFLRRPEPPVRVITGGKIDRLDFSDTDIVFPR